MIVGSALCSENPSFRPLYNNDLSPSVLSFPSASHQLILSASVPSLSNSLLKVLIDSGCTRSFVDSKLLRSSDCSTHVIDPPLSLRLFDGSVAPSGPITMYADLDFSLPGSKSERFRFLSTSLDSSCSLALGYDWLLERNPDIDWRSGQIRLRDPSKTPLPTPSDTVPTAQMVSVLLPTTVEPC